MALSNLQQDALRQHELYQYFTPPEDSNKFLSAHVASSPDTTLTALAQLCAIRLNAQRAMISLIGKDIQYFVAESTKTLSLLDTSKSEDPADNLWFGCGSVEKSGRLCERTIDTSSTTHFGQYPMFTVEDLSKDPRFNELPFVTGGPKFRFYAGTPLATKKGVNIGSIFVLDGKPRPALTQDQVNVIGTLAQTVMKHLELSAEAEERKKTVKLSAGLNAFVQGKRVSPRENTHNHASNARPKAESASTNLPRTGSADEHKTSQVDKREPAPRSRPHFDLNPGDSRSNVAADSSQDDSDLEDESQSLGDTGHRATLVRASNIIYEALDLHDHGGVVFFDSTTRLRHNANLSAEVNAVESVSEAPTSPTFPDVSDSQPTNPAVTLAVRTETQNFVPIDDHLLHNLLRRYPRGKLWTFDEDTSLSSSEEDASKRQEKVDRSESVSKRKHEEAAALKEYFPQATQIIFYGLWDAGSNRWFSAGFAFTTSARQRFSAETEKAFFVAFGNNIMAQVSRLSSMAADRQKADFIGSISHELRSPLHGILASAEFLAEATTDSFQYSLIDTVLSCGRTLLDTINHILDYSKINSFERTWQKARRSRGKPKGHSKHPKAVAEKEAPPMLNVYAVVDVARIAEEVIEGVYAGQVYQDIGSSMDSSDFSNSSRARPREKASERSIESNKRPGEKDVEVILDIQHDDYTFVTQPGALRRVIMNVLGNALKYTQKGSIKVRISLVDNQDDPVGSGATRSADLRNDKLLCIAIIDTGKGMSRGYLRTSLYKPFCQEDVLSSGTGLGLSIVRSIITMLQGEIDILSSVGIGTEVQMRIPLSRVPGSDTPMTTPSSDADTHPDESMLAITRDHQDTIIALCGFEIEKDGSGLYLKKCLEQWMGLQTVLYGPNSRPTAYGMVIVEDRKLEYMPQSCPVPILVVCKSTTRKQIASGHRQSAIMEFVAKPLGPYKLAKALRVCLDKAVEAKSCVEGPMEASTNGIMLKDPEDVIPELNQLTLETENRDAPVEVQINEILSASHSQNANMAIADAALNTDDSGDTTVANCEQFPFPSQENDKGPPIGGPKTSSPESSKDPIVQQTTQKAINGQLRPLPNGAMSSSNTIGRELSSRDEMTPKARPENTLKRSPRLLLVDDNKINLRLLQTCMKKRKYPHIDTAEDGQQAVQAADVQEEGYDIIFMDISMPIMNGFEATRAIRDIEAERGGQSSYETRDRPPALIIALTGLASGQDQAEAFASGVDLFLTKPVSFKEIGKLLDNWEKNGELDTIREKVTTPVL